MINCAHSLKIKAEEDIANGKKWALNCESTVLLNVNEEVFTRQYEDIDDNEPEVSKNIAPTVQSSDVKSEIRKTPLTDKKPVLSFNPKITNSLSNIIFVRLCPSKKEITAGQSYCDEAAEILDTIADKIGWKKENIYKTYLCKGEVKDVLSDINEFDTWKKNFYEEIKALKVSAIICWGEKVSQILSGKKEKIETLKDVSAKDNFGNRLFFSYEPFYIFKRLELRKPVWQTILKINNYLKTGKI